jgi:hypothetical protein
MESLPLRRIRVTTPGVAAMGTVLVLERTEGDPVIVAAGEKIPEARTGNYHTLHKVDVGNRAIGYSLVTPSADSTFPFTVVVSCGCQVTDPVVVVRDGLRNMAGALQPWVTGLIRAVSVRHDALRPADAEAAIMAALHGAYPPDGVRLTGFTVAVTTSDVAEIVTAQRELRVLEMRREGMRPVAHGGREEMLAHIMAMTDGDPTPLLDREQEAKESSTRASLQALSTLMGSDKIEEFDTSRISTKVMGEFFPGGDALLGGKRPGIRDRIDRKHKAIDSASVIDGDDKPDTAPKAERPVRGSEQAADKSADTSARPSRLRGSLRREDG